MQGAVIPTEVCDCALASPFLLFLRVDRPTLVSLITKEQFLAIAGPGNLQP